MTRSILLLSVKALSTMIAGAISLFGILPTVSSIVAVYFVMSRIGLVDRYPF
jgi:ABC-type maltose transport system permease subunit